MACLLLAPCCEVERAPVGGECPTNVSSEPCDRVHVRVGVSSLSSICLTDRTSAAPAVKGEPTPLVGSPPRSRGCRFLQIRGLSVCVGDRKSTRLNSSHLVISYAVFCLKKKNKSNEHGDGVATALCLDVS